MKDCKVWLGAQPKEASILISDGKIVRIGRRIPRNGCETFHCKGLSALPGMIDVHVHLRGLNLSYKEDFQTGTSAAVAGGVTTVLDMPNTIPPTDSPRRLIAKFQNAKNRILSNVGFHVAAVQDARSVKEMAKLGAFSMKLYMPRPISPIDVDNDDALVQILRLSKASGLLVTVHAEERRLIRKQNGGSAQNFARLADEHPAAAESKAVTRVIELARGEKSRIHFCHLTLPSSLRTLRQNAEIATSEVTPHHMLLSRETLLRSGWKAWMVPPLRGPKVARQTLQLVSHGQTTVIASDHAPHTIAEKSGPVSQSPPGVPGLETTLPLMLTLVNRGELSMPLLIQLFSTNPARIFNLPRKGKLSPGFDADIVLVDPKKMGRIRSDRFQSKAHYSPFEGTLTKGQVQTTIVSGKIVFNEGEITGRPGDGYLLAPGA